MAQHDEFMKAVKQGDGDVSVRRLQPRVLKIFGWVNTWCLRSWGRRFALLEVIPRTEQLERKVETGAALDEVLVSHGISGSFDVF